jgi:hypothetical protein
MHLPTWRTRDVKWTDPQLNDHENANLWSVVVQTVLYHPEVKDIQMKTYHKWELISEYYNDYNLIYSGLFIFSSIGTLGCTCSPGGQGTCQLDRSTA